MWWLCLFFISLSHAQDDNLKAIQDLEAELPAMVEYKDTDGNADHGRLSHGYKSPMRPVSIEKIVSSGTNFGAIQAGVPVRHLSDNKSYTLTKPIYVKYFNFEDEFGFKYISNKDGTVTWRIQSRYVEPMKQELVMYEPPLKYTPAPTNIMHHEYDTRLTLPPEASFYVGSVRGNYMADLFGDNKAYSGLTNQYGLHVFTKWNLPIKAGAVVNYEKASYELTGGGQIIYSALSFGPQFKTKDFEIFENPIRFQTQIRVSPLARAHAKTVNGNLNYQFNSTDLLASIERPIKNNWGEFVIGFFYQAQWLNLKNQKRPVNVEASNEINRSFGLSFSQVFQ